MLQVQMLPVGPFQANCYLITNPESGEIIVIDPGDEAETIMAAVGKTGGKVVEIWNTHGHFDHINANAPVQEITGAPISIHELERDWLQDPQLNLGAFIGLPFTPSKADKLWKGHEKFEAIGHSWEIHHVPGHSPGQCAIVCPDENLFFGGDLIMQGSIGRIDFPGCSAADMTESLRGLFNDWGRDEWRIMPGHGPESTVGKERRSNFLVKEALETGL